jgi:glycosyltransferase involved in cell wall biosynthesis
VKVLVQCDEVVGPSMAGAGIRYWEISGQLARSHAVTLASPFAPMLASPEFSVVQRPARPRPSYYSRYQAVLTPAVLPRLAVAKRRFGFRLIVDLYDPVILEGFELMAGRPCTEQSRAFRRMKRDLWLALRTGDHFICASEVQRDMWIGALTMAGRVTPEAYRADPTLRELIDVVAFGTTPQAGGRTGPGLRQRFGVESGDFVLLWGGGIWNWLDPLTLIESVAEVASEYADTKLVFMGLDHPNALIPEMAMSLRARKLADDLGLTGRHVFFNDGWVPYHQRQDVLLEADAGVSIHGDHLETHFAFRTRVLDYLSAGLPVLSTSGDVFADLLKSSGAGVVVSPHDRQAISDAIVSLREPSLRSRMSAASRSLGKMYRWERVVRPLMSMLEARTAVVRPNPARLTHSLVVMYCAAAVNRLRRLQHTRPC